MMDNRETIVKKLKTIRDDFNKNSEVNAQIHIAESRYFKAQSIIDASTKSDGSKKKTLTDKIDAIVCHRFFGPIILILTLLGVYELAIVQGYNLTNYWWPVLGVFQDAVESILPQSGFFADPLITSLVMWVVQGINSVLNYIPIFIILFALVAIMEDSGYMARIAFILDRIFKPFGLHGQSALPLMLGGLYVGGCAIPGIMSTRAIKDEKARLATILVVPLMNCLAKIPFYVLLIDIFFIEHAGFMMFMISTITIFVALIVSKILSLTVLKNYETAPFLMEMPAYHVPSLTNVLRRVVERTWSFLKKVLTIIILVMIALYFLLNFPGVGKDNQITYEEEVQGVVEDFVASLGSSSTYAGSFDTVEEMGDYFAFSARYGDAKRNVSDEALLKDINLKYLLQDPEYFKVVVKGSFELDEEILEGFELYKTDYEKALSEFRTYTAYLSAEETVFESNRFYEAWENANPVFFSILRSGKISVSGTKITDGEAKNVAKLLKTTDRDRKTLQKLYHDETLRTSYLGTLGIWLEPVTKYLGFNWKINVGLISALAAKENTVATLGSIYQSDSDEEAQQLGEKMAEQEEGMTPLHAAAMIIFMALYPPCLATLITISAEAGFKWMFFSLIYQTIIGFIFAFLIFTGGSLLGLSGLQSMLVLYIILFVLLIIMGLVKPKNKKVVV